MVGSAFVKIAYQPQRSQETQKLLFQRHRRRTPKQFDINPGLRQLLHLSAVALDPFEPGIGEQEAAPTKARAELWAHIELCSYCVGEGTV